jgi:hypothetical protein
VASGENLYLISWLSTHLVINSGADLLVGPTNVILALEYSLEVPSKCIPQTIHMNQGDSNLDQLLHNICSSNQ